MMADPKPRSKPTAAFKPKTVYKFGRIQKGTTSDPTWLKLPIAVPGKFFLQKGTRTLMAWLEKNPDKFNPEQLLTFYEVDPKNGNLKYFGEGNPSIYQAPIDDDDEMGPLTLGEVYDPKHAKRSGGSGSNEAMSIMQRMLEQEKATNRELLEEIRSVHREHIKLVEDKHEILSTLKSVNAANEMREVSEREMDKLSDRFEKERSKSSPLGDLLEAVQIIAQVVQEFRSGSSQGAFKGGANGAQGRRQGPRPVPPTGNGHDDDGEENLFGELEEVEYDYQ